MPGQHAFVAGGTPVAASAQDLQRNQLLSGVTLLQPSAPAFRLSDALAKLDPSTLVQEIEVLQGQVAALQEQVTTLEGQVATLQGQVTPLQAFMNSFNWVQAEVATGTYFLDSRLLYTRSFAISSALNTANNVYTLLHGIEQINYVAQGIGMAALGGSIFFPLTYGNVSQSPMTDGVSFWADVNYLYIANGNQVRTNYLVLIKLYYTCTNR
jgi:hypothetical protein